MKKVLLSICLIVTLSACSTIAYVKGYNVVTSKEKEIGFEPGMEESPTANIISSMEMFSAQGKTNALMAITIPIGFALSPVFFIVGNISGAANTFPNILTPIEERPQKERRKLANIETSGEILIKLAKDHSSSVRRAVASNVNTPPETLAILATDKKMYVRRAVANNLSTLPQTLVLLLKDKELYVRYAAEKNPNTPKQAIKKQTKSKKENQSGWWKDLPYMGEVENWFSNSEENE